MDYSSLQGGLRRMLDRLTKEGTATKDREVDQFLRDNANAVVLGLLYDQRVLAETAFTGPYKLYQRLGHLDMRKIAEMDREAFFEVFTEVPAVHRFTNTMVDRTQQVAQILADEYEGDAANLWAGDVDLQTVEKRLQKLPGFGPMKATKAGYVCHYFGHRTFGDE
ncbi:MAG: hypothetical protein AAGI08_18695 [Bacteroidota bacterium]